MVIRHNKKKKQITTDLTDGALINWAPKGHLNAPSARKPLLFLTGGVLH
jgi:hypothetical protein